MPVTIARSKGESWYSQNLPCAYESAEPARGLVRTALAVWTMDSLVDDAVLVVSELVGNAARHTRSHLIRVSMTRLAQDTVLVAVLDKGKAEAVRRDPGLDDTNGRGLVLVEAVSERWGVASLPSGKWVWALLTTSESKRRPDPTRGVAVTDQAIRAVLLPALPHHLPS